MPNYTLTEWAKAQQLAKNEWNKSEMVYDNPEVFLEYLRNSNQMISNLDAIKMSESRVLEISYQKRIIEALVTGRTHNHSFGKGGDSAVMTPTWNTKGTGFNVSLKEADNNAWSTEQLLANKMLNYWITSSDEFETLANNHLFANRSQVNISTQEGTFDAVDDVFEIIESTHGERAIQITRMSMKDNLLKGGMIHFCDNIAFNKFQFQAAQGAQNSTNLSFQFNGDKFINASALGVLGAGLVSAYAKGFWITAQVGSFGVMPWLPMINRKGNVSTEGTFGRSAHPILQTEFAMHSHTTAADTSASGGETQDEVTDVEFTLDYSFNNVPKAGAGESSLMAFALV